MLTGILSVHTALSKNVQNYERETFSTTVDVSFTYLVISCSNNANIICFVLVKVRTLYDTPTKLWTFTRLTRVATSNFILLKLRFEVFQIHILTNIPVNIKIKIFFFNSYVITVNPLWIFRTLYFNWEIYCILRTI